MIMNFGLIRMTHLGPIFTKINRARAAAQSVYAIIDRVSYFFIQKYGLQVPEIDSYSTEGSCPPVEGRITVQNLSFTYPTRRDVQVLKVCFRNSCGLRRPAYFRKSGDFWTQNRSGRR